MDTGHATDHATDRPDEAERGAKRPCKRQPACQAETRLDPRVPRAEAVGQVPCAPALRQRPGRCGACGKRRGMRRGRCPVWRVRRAFVVRSSLRNSLVVVRCPAGCAHGGRAPPPGRSAIALPLILISRTRSRADPFNFSSTSALWPSGSAFQAFRRARPGRAPSGPRSSRETPGPAPRALSIYIIIRTTSARRRTLQVPLRPRLGRSHQRRLGGVASCKRTRNAGSHLVDSYHSSQRAETGLGGLAVAEVGRVGRRTADAGRWLGCTGDAATVVAI